MVHIGELKHSVYITIIKLCRRSSVVESEEGTME